MAIQTRDQLLAKLPESQLLRIFKLSETTKGAGFLHSLYYAAGDPQGSPNPPLYTSSGGQILEKGSVAGAVPFANPSTGLRSYLTMMNVSAAQLVRVILYDRLYHVGGFSSITTAAQHMITTAPPLTRPDALGRGCELWGEVTTAWSGSGGATVTVRYTNQEGTPGRVATALIPAGAVVRGQIFRFTLQEGDTGIASVDNNSTVTFSASTGGTAGSLALVIVRRVAEVKISVAHAGEDRNVFDLGMPEIHPNAYLALAIRCASGTSGDVDMGMRLTQG